MKTYTLKEISDIFNVNRATVYKWTKRHKATLGNNLAKGPKGLYLTEEGRKILDRLVNGEATTNERPATGQDPILDEYRDMLRQQSETIRQLQQDIRDMINNQREERQRTDSLIYNLTNQVCEQAILIEDLRQQRQEVIVPVYEATETELVQDDIMDVDTASEDLLQDVVVEVCEEPPAATAEPARESLEPEEQGIPAVAAVEEEKPTTQEKIMEKPSHPKHSWGLFKRLWVNMFQPELLRESQG